jgi:uncharacterized protein (DUF1800 family)
LVRKLQRRYLIPAALALALGVLPRASAPGVLAAPLSPATEEAISHVLNRLAFGARAGDAETVRRLGIEAWIERQLHPDRIEDEPLQAKLARLTTIGLPSATIAQEYVAPARQERRRRQSANAADTNAMTAEAAGTRQPMTETIRRARQVFSDLAEAKILRAVYSERQLEEVLVDFWFNHFNVFARKGQTEIYIGEFEREAIRPHVLGTFRDLLGATAKSPAMLVYLDNWLSVDPKTTAVREQTAATPGQGRARGLNENYARELLELHTLGVDGGYTQQDVIDVARAFTGWTIGRPRDGGFRFAAARHDRGEKHVLGHIIRAGGGIDDGERVLDIIANHPATARHVAYKLAQRFISDDPSPAVVDRAAARFRETKGDLREVVRAIVTSPDFFAPQSLRAKVKTPFELVVSALRATGADVSSAAAVARALTSMGMPLYLCQPPTGYAETAEAWVSSGSLVNRINFAVELTSNRLRGVRVTAPRTAVDIGAAAFQRQ